MLCPYAAFPGACLTCVLHGLQQLGDQRLVLRLLRPQQAQLLPHGGKVEAVVQVHVLLQDGGGAGRGQLGGQGLAQLPQVPPAHGGLRLVRVAAGVVRAVADEIRIKPGEEGRRLT